MTGGTTRMRRIFLKVTRQRKDYQSGSCKARLSGVPKQAGMKSNGMAEGHALTRTLRQSYRNSSMTRSSTSGPGLTAEGGNVASGSSVMFSMSRNVGDCVFTYKTPV